MEMNILERNNQPKERYSGVELLKIFGILLVVISHVVQTLQYNGNELLGYNDYFVDLNLPTSNVSYLILSILRHSGHLGNSIFFLSSAWFFLDSKKTNFKKILRMICDIWVISVLMLLPCLIISGGNIELQYILRSFFPTICFNNWYATTYIIFCLFYPIFNKIISKIDFKKHLLLIGLLLILFIGLNTLYKLTNDLNVVEPFVNLSIWTLLYFIVAFLKKYAINLCKNIKLNFILCFSSITFLICTILLLNYLGLKYPNLQISILMFNSKNSIFLLVIAFSALNIFNSLKFKNSFINYFSKFSLLIYIIHENLVFKKYYRPVFWQLIYLNFGYKYILLWTILFILILFLVSTLISFIYKILLQRHINHISDKIYEKTKNFIKNKKQFN